MKKLLLFLLAFSILTASFYFLVNDLYIGDVVGEIKVSEKYVPKGDSLECVDISFNYKTSRGKIQNVVLYNKNPDFLQNTEKGRRLIQERKYYSIPAVLGLCIGFGITGSLIMLGILVGSWICYVDDYNFDTPKEDFGCHHCGLRELCYFENSKIHISEKSKLLIKQFFGY